MVRFIKDQNNEIKLHKFILYFLHVSTDMTTLYKKKSTIYKQDKTNTVSSILKWFPWFI
jgi:hypothetical protein